MSRFNKRYLRCGCRAMVLMMVVLIGLAFGKGRSNGETFDKNKRLIVLDPGHGGFDKGVEGPGGTLEKTVTLLLGQRLVAALSEKYRVTLTRTDDYGMKIFDRTALANHLKADLFISLHTGGSFLHKASGVLIFYFDETSGSHPTPDAALSKPERGLDTPVAWRKIQTRHQKESRILAESMAQRFDIKPRLAGSRIKTAPLMVLEGADMPAILIEIGYLTNPAEEKKFRDPDQLSDLAEQIKNGIGDFFSKTEIP